MFTVYKPDSVPKRLHSFISPGHHRPDALASATNPKFSGEQPNSLFRLAPDWVYLAIDIAAYAVSSYLAVSPLPAFTGGLFSVTQPSESKTRPSLSRGILLCGVRTFLSRV